MNDLTLIDATFICTLAALAYSDLHFLHKFQRPTSHRHFVSLVALAGVALSQQLTTLLPTDIYLLGTGVATLSHLKSRRNQLLSRSHLLIQATVIATSYFMFMSGIPPSLFLLAVAGLTFFVHRSSFLRESSTLHSDFIDLKKKLLTQQSAQIFPDEIQARNR